MPTLKALKVGNYLLELCTPRAGEMEALKDLSQDRRIGIGVVNPKTEIVESLEEIVAKAKSAADLFGADRIFLNPDCGFATFADNPVCSAQSRRGKTHRPSARRGDIEGSIAHQAARRTFL